MVPTKWLVQKHSHCEDVDNSIEDSHEDPTSVAVDIRMKNQEKERDGVVSEL